MKGGRAISQMDLGQTVMVHTLHVSGACQARMSMAFIVITPGGLFGMGWDREEIQALDGLDAHAR